MRRGYDPDYGSRQQLKDCHEAGMKLRREVDALKAEIVELKALIKYISEGEWLSNLTKRKQHSNTWQANLYWRAEQTNY